MEIGERIKNRRIELNMTQEDLAKKIGYSSKTTIAKIEANANQLRQSKIKKIAEALDTTPSYIMGWEDEEVAPVQNSDFDDFELGLIKQFRAADTETQEMIIKLLAFSAKMKKEQNDME